MRICIIWVTILSAGACALPHAAPGEVPLAQRVAGCYELALGEWRTSEALARFYPPDRIPTRFRLRTALLAGWDALQSDSLPLFSVDAYPAGREAGSLFRHWRPVRVGSDTLRVTYPLPLAGATLQLSPTGDDLAGEVITFTDYIAPDGVTEARAPIVAQRVACP